MDFTDKWLIYFEWRKVQLWKSGSKEELGIVLIAVAYEFHLFYNNTVQAPLKKQ